MDKFYALAINLIPLLNCNEKMAVAHKFQNFTDFQKLKGHDFFHALGPEIKQTKHRLSTFENFSAKELWTQTEQTYEKLEKRKIHITHIFDEESYPPLLREIHNPPFMLFYMGTLPDPEQPALAVVGTRRPHINAKNETSLFVREVAPSIGSIVSGLAIGIDGAAHRATLSAKAHTTAVLGSGFDFIYPRANKKLAVDIVHSGGALITEYLPETQPAVYTFPERNRIVAGLSRSLIVMEAPHRSGALITAELALDQGRDVFVHRVGLKRDSGVEKLYEQGAIVLERGADLLYAWGIGHVPKLAPAKPKPVKEEDNVLEETPAKTKGKTYDIAKILAENTANDIGWDDLDES